jgi:hypothetical protein
MYEFLISRGRPKSSLYFIGVEGENLIYLDPHYIRPTVPLMDSESYHKEVCLYTNVRIFLVFIAIRCG